MKIKFFRSKDSALLFSITGKRYYLYYIIDTGFIKLKRKNSEINFTNFDEIWDDIGEILSEEMKKILANKK